MRVVRTLLAAAIGIAAPLTSARRALASEHLDVTAPVSTCEASLGNDALANLGEAVAAAARPLRFGCEEKTPTGAKALAASSHLDVPADLQGETNDCGYHAIRMIMKYWRDRGRLTLVASIAKLRDLGQGGSADPTRQGYTTPQSLLGVVTRMGFEGHASADNYLFRSPSMADIRASLDKGIPVAVMIQADEHGCPFHDPGHWHSHWVVLEGFTRGDDGREYVVAKNPQSDADMLWRVDDFAQSWGDSRHGMLTFSPTQAAAVLSLVPSMEE